MFSVSRKPLTSNPGKFLIKSEATDNKVKTDDNQPKPILVNRDGNVRKLFENSNSSKYSPPPSEKATTVSSAVPKEENKEMRRIKIRLSIIRDVPYSQKSLQNATTEANSDKKVTKKTKEMKIKNKRMNREGNFNCGRWQPEEHERFIEAIMKYGNEWKSVQKHVGTRSSTQARSHAQKFFVKIKKANLADFNLDLSKNSIKTLHEIANTMNAEEYFNAIKQLNCVAFERKNCNKRRFKKEDMSDDTSLVFNEAPNPLNLNNEDLFSLNTNDNSLFNANKPFENLYKNFNSHIDINSLLNKNGNYQIKIVQNENNKEKKQKNKEKSSGGNNTIIINNNINTYNYNVNINNYNCKEENNIESNFLRKRNRLNSFEGIINMFPDLGRECKEIPYYYKKVFDENEYVDNFNCTFKTVKNDFKDEMELENILQISQSENSSNSLGQINLIEQEFIFSHDPLKKENDLLEINDFMLDFELKKEINNFELDLDNPIIEDINKSYITLDTNFLKF